MALARAPEAAAVPPRMLAITAGNAAAPHPLPSSEHDDVDAVARNMLKRKKRAEENEKDDPDDSEDDASSSGMSVAKLVKKKPAAGKLEKTKPAAGKLKKPVKKVSKHCKPKAKKVAPVDWPKKPSFSVEWSRKQVMCRTGQRGPGTTLRITFKSAGGSKVALAKAEAWVRSKMKKYDAFKKA